MPKNGLDYYITEALFQLMEKKDFADISIKEIVDKACVARVSFYRYFKTKEDVIIKYMADKKMLFNESIIDEEIESDNYKKIIIIVFETAKKNYRFYKLLIKNNLQHLLLDKINNGIVDQVLNHGQTNKYYGYAYSGAFYNILIKWMENKCEEPVEVMARSLYEMVLKE